MRSQQAKNTDEEGKTSDKVSSKASTSTDNEDQNNAVTENVDGVSEQKTDDVNMVSVQKMPKPSTEGVDTKSDKKKSSVEGEDTVSEQEPTIEVKETVSQQKPSTKGVKLVSTRSPFRRTWNRY